MTTKKLYVQSVTDLQVGQLYITRCSLEQLDDTFSGILSTSTASSTTSLPDPYLNGLGPAGKKAPPRIVLLLDKSASGLLTCAPLTTRNGRTIADDNNFRPDDDKEKMRRLLRPVSPMVHPEAFRIVEAPKNKYNPAVQYIHLLRYQCHFAPDMFVPIKDDAGRISHMDDAELGRYMREASKALDWLLTHQGSTSALGHNGDKDDEGPSEDKHEKNTDYREKKNAKRSKDGESDAEANKDANERKSDGAGATANGETLEDSSEGPWHGWGDWRPTFDEHGYLNLPDEEEDDYLTDMNIMIANALGRRPTHDPDCVEQWRLQTTNTQPPVRHTQTVTSNPDGSVTRQDTTTTGAGGITPSPPYRGTQPVVQGVTVPNPPDADNAVVQAKQTERAAQDVQANYKQAGKIVKCVSQRIEKFKPAILYEDGCPVLSTAGAGIRIEHHGNLWVVTQDMFWKVMQRKVVRWQTAQEFEIHKHQCPQRTTIEVIPLDPLDGMPRWPLLYLCHERLVFYPARFVRPTDPEQSFKELRPYFLGACLSNGTANIYPSASSVPTGLSRSGSRLIDRALDANAKASEALEPFFKNKALSGVLQMMFVAYASLIAPQIPKEWHWVFEHAGFRIGVMFLILWTSNSDPTFTITLAVAFILLLQNLGKFHLTEGFEGPKTAIYPGCMNLKVADLLSSFNNSQEDLMQAMQISNVPFLIHISDDTAPLIGTYLMNKGYKIVMPCAPPGSVA
ncbi:uncharacterized protein EV422DRAFT_507040 [Fimicolochytrium jonesii]|uniref:uncharacterized protein n=1 Tax=Fimicolochytrium jonesii TaxID=1396493 RepID=UPI0022FDD0F4|nr:uncharacterized protein EV422DRAFT_507040 [Fimicolochytrium jonesii]KAI8819847.1 hypothetical protein EV422DRAFT_507040 [Fimicolochytrium jonesii]